MRCKLAIAAREVLIAQDTGIPSAINIIEGINAAGFPTLVPGLAFLSVWTREDGDAEEHKGQIVVKVDDVELIRAEAYFSFQGRPFTRHIAQFPALIVPQPGVLDFRAEFDGLIGNYTVNARLLTEQRLARIQRPVPQAARRVREGRATDKVSPKKSASARRRKR
jgi:hypothetical protein